jgi:hypothetical protein
MVVPCNPPFSPNNVSPIEATTGLTVNVETLLTIIFVLVDDWYQAKGYRLLKGKRGAKPVFCDSEVLTLLLAMDFFPFPGENQFLGFIRANYLNLFPRLLDQSQFNRRARGLHLLVEELRKHWAVMLGVTLQTQFLLDAKPVPVVGYKRDKSHSHFRGTADFGVCISRNMKYFGYKLIMLSTLDGIPVSYELVAANTDDRQAADEVLWTIRNCDVFCDKGFLSEDWQQGERDLRNNRIWTQKKSNQKEQNPVEFDRLLNKVRERIEGTFNEIQNTGRNLERLLRKTVQGLSTHVITKMTSYTLKLVLRRFFGIDVQTFQTIPV